MVDYPDYLQLDRLLSAQAPESDKLGAPARDELLFIIIHQTYELWFKQILHELDLVENTFSGDQMDDAFLSDAVHGLGRVVEILKVLVSQVDILETMTPLDFLDFRDLLVPASGFQSFQWRLIETRLGLRPEDRIAFDGQPFEKKLRLDEQTILLNLAKEASLLDRIDAWLARTPFLVMEDYDFAEAYRKAVAAMFDNERAIVQNNKSLTDEDKQRQHAAFDASEETLTQILDVHAAENGWRFSAKALRSALFINLYRDEPAAHLPFQLLSLLMDIDELMAAWRHRHALLVQRMIGAKVGTGGSSGHGYLAETATRYRIFGDLFALTTYLIPRSALPPLPTTVQSAMRYQYSAK
ncbi:MAG: tryptophan 2,3-dioxygenase [Alphaproteobacteria bacterium]|nr:MAG: tryptophan 2,3-dioxygenase [Alphaproteobacteria bacterium]